MKKLLNQDAFNFTTDKAFAQVIGNCKTIRRKGQAGTWITTEVKKAYTVLGMAFVLGLAVTAILMVQFYATVIRFS